MWLTSFMSRNDNVEFVCTHALLIDKRPREAQMWFHHLITNHLGWANASDDIKYYSWCWICDCCFFLLSTWSCKCADDMWHDRNLHIVEEFTIERLKFCNRIRKGIGVDVNAAACYFIARARFAASLWKCSLASK